MVLGRQSSWCSIKCLKGSRAIISRCVAIMKGKAEGDVTPFRGLPDIPVSVVLLVNNRVRDIVGCGPLCQCFPCEPRRVGGIGLTQHSARGSSSTSKRRLSLMGHVASTQKLLRKHARGGANLFEIRSCSNSTVIIMSFATRSHIHICAANFGGGPRGVTSCPGHSPIYIDSADLFRPSENAR